MFSWKILPFLVNTNTQFACNVSRDLIKAGKTRNGQNSKINGKDFAQLGETKNKYYTYKNKQT